MKSIIVTSALAILFASSGFAAPTDYTPPGGWESIKYPPGTGENLHEYPAPPGGWENVKYPPGTGENLHEYPAPPGGWENVKYPPGTGAKPPKYHIPDCKPVDQGPFTFTSYYHVVATPDQVVNGTTPTGGLKGAKGFYDIAINSKTELICWKIVLNGFRGNYQSPAKTATHIHAAQRGASGPPKVAFPNPVGDEKEAVSLGCQYGPFKTGVVTNGVDSGDGFTLKMLEDNPSGYMADVHSSLAVPGAVRGQFA